MTYFLMSNKRNETINDVEDIFIKENKGTIRVPRLFDLKIALLLTVEFLKSQRQVFERGHTCFVWLQVFISIISPCIHGRSTNTTRYLQLANLELMLNCRLQ